MTVIPEVTLTAHLKIKLRSYQSSKRASLCVGVLVLLSVLKCSEHGTRRSCSSLPSMRSHLLLERLSRRDLSKRSCSHL